MRPSVIAHALHSVALVVSCVLAALPVCADPMFDVSVDTSALSGSNGFLDFQFNPGAGAEPAFVSITNFSTDGALLASPAPAVSGDVTGLLPALVQITNTDQFNDLFTALQFGSTIHFDLTFGGPAVTSPSGSAQSGSAFGFALFASDGITSLLTVNPDGFALTAALDTTGALTVQNYPSDSAGSPPVVNASPTAVPEPSSLALFAGGLLALCCQVRARSRTNRDK
jgi:hypothetical protein